MAKIIDFFKKIFGQSKTGDEPVKVVVLDKEALSELLKNESFKANPKTAYDERELLSYIYSFLRNNQIAEAGDIIAYDTESQHDSCQRLFCIKTQRVALLNLSANIDGAAKIYFEV